MIDIVNTITRKTHKKERRDFYLISALTLLLIISFGLFSETRFPYWIYSLTVISCLVTTLSIFLITVLDYFKVAVTIFFSYLNLAYFAYLWLFGQRGGSSAAAILVLIVVTCHFIKSTKVTTLIFSSAVAFSFLIYFNWQEPFMVNLKVLRESGSMIMLIVVPVVGASFLVSKRKENHLLKSIFGYVQFQKVPGVYIWDYIYDELKQVYKHGRERNLICVVMVKIDGIIKVNQFYGYTIGDHVLQGIASSLLRVIGKHGIVTRYRDDKFLIFFQKSDEEVISSAIHDIKSVINEHTNLHGHGLTPYVEYGLSTDFKELGEMVSSLDNQIYILYKKPPKGEEYESGTSLLKNNELRHH